MKLMGLEPTDDDAVSRAHLDAALAARDARIERVDVDFGDDDTTALGVGFAEWVTADMIIICVPDPAGSADHSAEDAIVEGVTAVVTYLEPGIGFELVATCPDSTWGRYTLACTPA